MTEQEMADKIVKAAGIMFVLFFVLMSFDTHILTNLIISIIVFLIGLVFIFKQK